MFTRKDTWKDLLTTIRHVLDMAESSTIQDHELVARKSLTGGSFGLLIAVIREEFDDFEATRTTYQDISRRPS